MALTQVKSDGIATGAVGADQIATGAVTANDLEDSGVTAGTYGSSSAIPAITVDAKGRVTSASTSSIDSTAITNGTSNVSVSASGNITATRAGSTKLTVNNTGIDVTGTATCDGLTSDGQVTVQNTAEWQLIVKDSNSGGSAAETGIAFRDSGNTTQGYIGHVASGNNVLYVFIELNEELLFGTGGTGRCRVQSDGHFTPNGSNTYDLGSSTSQWRNGHFDGTVYCDGLTTDGNFTLTNGDMTIGSSTDTSVNVRVDFEDSGGIGVINLNAHGTADFKFLYNRTGSSNTGIPNSSGGIATNYAVPIYFANSATARAYFDTNGHFRPAANNTYDLGSSTERWRNVYTNDLNLSNEGGTNDVDGTWGSWTIQEGEDDLFLLNRRNGKKYKFNLSEVN